MTFVYTLPYSLQQIVDSRLDSIERILLSTNMNRSERREVVQSVEDQIYELLSRDDKVEPSRDDVLAVLAMTDPPEAYLSSADGPKKVNSPSEEGRPMPTERVLRTSPLAIVSCVLGILSFFSVIIWPVSAITGLTAIVCGVIALTQICYTNHFKGVWLSIVGVCSPVIATIVFLVLILSQA